MSKVPYVFQQDRPNLVIVPTVTCYSPSPENAKLDNTSSSNKVPVVVQASEKSAIVSATVKVKPHVSSVNENVLIDVSKVKRQPNSWATNFLQSIGGTTSKLPRAYNGHSSASKHNSARNESIQPIKYLPIVRSDTYTTQSNANKETIQPKSIKEHSFSEPNKNISQPKPNNDSSLSNRTNVTKLKPQISQPKVNKEARRCIDSKVRISKTVNKDSHHTKANKEATPKAEEDATQPKPTKEVIYQKYKKKLAHLISDTKKESQGITIVKKSHKETTKLGKKTETIRKKVNEIASCSSGKNIHKKKFKCKTLNEITQKKPSKTQNSETETENISRKKLKVDGKKSRESTSDKNKKLEDSHSKKIKSGSSKCRTNTSPIKSVVNKIKNNTSNDSKHTNKYNPNHKNHSENMSNDSDVDLRAKLKRRAPKNDMTEEHEIKDKRKCKNIFSTLPKGKGFVPNENLIISFDTENDTEEVIEKIQPVKTKTRKQQSGGNKCKKIKLEINILFHKDDTTDDESSKSEDREDYENYNDLSFLDDINVDEIVESLNDCQSNTNKIDNLINLTDNKLPSKMDVDLPTLNDKNTMTNNYECSSRDQKVLENKTTHNSNLTRCDENTIVKTENKAIGSVIKVESLTDHNTIAGNNNDTSEMKSKDIIEVQRVALPVNVMTDKISNAVGTVKTEFVENYSKNMNENRICPECCRDLSATNPNNMNKLSESVTHPGDGKSKNDNILTYTEIKSEEVQIATSQLDIKNTKRLQKASTETETTNIYSGKLAEKLTTYQNEILSSDVKNNSSTKSGNNHTTTVNSIKVKTDEASTFVDNNKNDEVILIEDSDNDCDKDMDKVQVAQCPIKHDIIDLTIQKDSSFVTGSKETSAVDALNLKTNGTDSEPILILDTDYVESKTKDDLINTKEILEPKQNHTPIGTTKKHLFSNSDIPSKSDTCTLFSHKSDSKTKNDQSKGKDQITRMTKNCPNKSDDVKIKNVTVKSSTPSVDSKKDTATISNITPIDKKPCAKAGQDRTQTKTQSQKEPNDDKTSAIVKDTKHCAKSGQARAQTKTLGQTELNGDKTCAIVKEQMLITKENKIIMQVDKNDTITPNIVAESKQKSITQEHRSDKLNVDVKSAITDKLLSHTNENDDINITIWLENKISQDMKANAKTTKDGQKHGKLNDKVKSASTGNRTSSVNENRDGHIRMWVVNKGDTRSNTVVEKQPKINPEDTKDGKPKLVENVTDNITPNMDTKCQPNESNKTSTRATSIVNKNTPATAKQDDKTNLVKGDPRIRQNQPKTNLQDKKDDKPKVQNKSNTQTKGNNFVIKKAERILVQIDQNARRCENRMRQYFGAKYWITALLHSGRFSTIYLCKDGTGASKTVKLIKGAWQIGAHKEGMMMKLQDGVPENNYNCIRYWHGFSVGGQWCYVMEFYPKSLQQVMNLNNKSFHIDKVQEFSRQLVAAVTVLRNNNIIHSDINPSHILINDLQSRIKLCGFDQAFYYNGGDMLPNVGTVNYRAPELILGYQANYGIDVWSTALVMYEMATNRQLFPGHFNNDILYKQYCTVNSFPYELLERCYYRDQHFMGNAFVRIVGSRGEGKILIQNFPKKERIHSTLLQVYHAEWAKSGTNLIEARSKLSAMGKLLDKMLTMDPNRRIAIEFVFADPFVYEGF